MLILASTSIYRAELLNRLGFPFETTSPAVDESRLTNEPFNTMAARLSEAKAKSASYPNALIIGSDQVAVVGDRQLHKPGSVNHAVKQLTLISGRTVKFYTGVSLWNTATDRCQTEVVQYKATLRDLTVTKSKLRRSRLAVGLRRRFQVGAFRNFSDASARRR